MRKIIFIILVLLLYFCPTFAENIEGFLKNGRLLNEGDVLLLNDTCIFKFNNSQQGVEYNWIVRIDQKDDGSYELKNQMSEHASFTFCIDSTLYRNAGLGKTFKRTILENDSCVYYTAQVYCYAENILQGVFPLKIDLLPSIPSFTNIELIYDGFDDKYLLFKNDTIRFTINTSKSNQLFVKRADHKRGNEYFFDLIFQYFLDITSKKSNISIPAFDFEECYTLEASNENGAVASSDTVFVIDYIEDENILNAIRTWTSNANLVKNKSVEIVYNPRSETLQIQDDLLPILSYKIYDSKGRLVKKENCVANIIHVSDLSKGIYLATFHSSKWNKYIVCKFLR